MHRDLKTANVLITTDSVVKKKTRWQILGFTYIQGFGYSAKTFYYNHNYGNWSDGPKLNQGRKDHAVGIVTDEATQEKLVTVTGGWDGPPNTLKSTEVLLAGTWSIGEKW